MTDISVTNVPPRVVYIARAATLAAPNNVYQFNFAIYNSSNIDVYVTLAGVVADDSTQLLLPVNQYTVTVAVPPAVGGTVTINSDYITLNAGDRITIVRNTLVQRNSNYVDGGLLSASTLNSDMNYVVMEAQESQMYNTAYSPHYNISENLQPSDYTLPKLLPGQVWMKSTDGTAIQSVGIGAGTGIAASNPAINSIPVFTDSSTGNIAGTGVTISANNISGVGTINCSTVSASNVDADSVSCSNVNSYTATSDNVVCSSTLTVGVGGQATINNLTTQGALTVQGTFSIPSLTITGIVSGTSVFGSVQCTAPMLTVRSSSVNTGVAFKAPAGMTLLYNLILPPALPITANQVLTSTTTGKMSWMTSNTPTRAFVKFTLGSDGYVNIAPNMVNMTFPELFVGVGIIPTLHTANAIKININNGVFSDNNYTVKAYVSSGPYNFNCWVNDNEKTATSFLLRFTWETGVNPAGTLADPVNTLGLYIYVECT